MKSISINNLLQENVKELLNTSYHLPVIFIQELITLKVKYIIYKCFCYEFFTFMFI